jgi:hypothetical protein
MVSAPSETRLRYEVLLGLSTLKQAIAMYNVTDVAAWLLTAVGLVYRDTLLHVNTVMVDHYAGSEYLYRVFASE